MVYRGARELKDGNTCILPARSFLFAESCHKKDIALVYCVREEVPTIVQGDQGRIRQILNNPLDNAIKFTERGEVALEVRMDDSTTQRRR